MGMNYHAIHINEMKINKRKKKQKENYSIKTGKSSINISETNSVSSLK